jgi:hypothetical protein
VGTVGGKKALVAIAAIAVAAGALAYIIWSQTSREGPAATPDELVSFELGAPAFFVCEACGAQTTGTQRPTPYPCAKCGKEAVVESVRLKCGACGKTFEAHRRRTVMSADGRRAVGVETKAGGGAWQRAQKPAAKCPGCDNDDPARLSPAVPMGF